MPFEITGRWWANFLQHWRPGSLWRAVPSLRWPEKAPPAVPAARLLAGWAYWNARWLLYSGRPANPVLIPVLQHSVPAPRLEAATPDAQGRRCSSGPDWTSRLSGGPRFSADVRLFVSEWPVLTGNLQLCLGEHQVSGAIPVFSAVQNFSTIAFLADLLSQPISLEKALYVLIVGCINYLKWCMQLQS